jgi:phosphate transport system substrate-binding protein
LNHAYSCFRVARDRFPKESAVGPKGYLLQKGLVAAPAPVRARSQQAARSLTPLNLASIK